MSISFTSKLTAYSRHVESQRKEPLMVDPFVMDFLDEEFFSWLEKHPRYQSMQYPVVRSHFIETEVISKFNLIGKQLVLLGAGLDTRAYRCSNLEEISVFEVDFPEVIEMKEKVLKGIPIKAKEITRVSADLSQPNWSETLIKAGYNSEIPTLWVLEGLVYYIQIEDVKALFKEITAISSKNSMLFCDVCTPGLTIIRRMAVLKHMIWGLNVNQVPDFFKEMGWNATGTYADEYDYGRDVGQKNFIYVTGTLNKV